MSGYTDTEWLAPHGCCVGWAQAVGCCCWSRDQGCVRESLSFAYIRGEQSLRSRFLSAELAQFEKGYKRECVMHSAPKAHGELRDPHLQFLGALCTLLVVCSPGPTAVAPALQASLEHAPRLHSFCAPPVPSRLPSNILSPMFSNLCTL